MSEKRVLVDQRGAIGLLLDHKLGERTHARISGNTWALIDVATVITERRLKRDFSSIRAIWPSRYKDSGLDEKRFLLRNSVV